MNYIDCNSSKKSNNLLNLFNQTPPKIYQESSARKSRSRSKDKFKLGFSPMHAFAFPRSGNGHILKLNAVNNLGYSFERKLDNSSSSRRYSHKKCHCKDNCHLFKCIHGKNEQNSHYRSSGSSGKMNYSRYQLPKFLHPKLETSLKITDFTEEYENPYKPTPVNQFEKNIFNSPLSHQKTKHAHNYEQSTNVCVNKKRESLSKKYQSGQVSDMGIDSSQVGINLMNRFNQ